jgi:VanZ family protein
MFFSIQELFPKREGCGPLPPLLRYIGFSVHAAFLKAPVKTIRIIAWLLAAAIVVLSLVPPGLRPTTPAPHDLEHLAIFAALGFAFGLSYGPQYAVAIGLLVFAVVVEIAQLFVPGRHARLSDLIVDVVAVCLGWAASAILMRRLKPNFDH